MAQTDSPFTRSVPGGSARVAHLALPRNWMEPSHRAVGMDPALAARAFEAGVGEHLADDEAARLVGVHLAGDRRGRGQQADQQRNFTHHHRHST